MFLQLLSLLENSNENGMSLAEISRALNAQPSAVLAMIGLLVQKGKLIEIGPDGNCCTVCGLESECNLLKARGKRYLPAPDPLRPPGTSPKYASKNFNNYPTFR